MSMRTLTLLVFAVLGVAALVVYVAGRRRLWGTAPLGEVVDVLRSRTAGRAVLVGVWAWLGWHFLAR